MRSILCIDDDARSLMIRGQILERHGYRVLSAPSGAEGLRLFSTEPIDAVVLDHFMPGMSGAEVAWELKRRGSTIPVIMLSSAVFCPETASDVVDAFCAKIDGPIAFLELLDRLVRDAQSSGGTEKRCILHVGDDKFHRYACSRMLRRAGFRVLEAANDEDAIDQTRKLPDLILIDIQNAEPAGFELSRRIKANPDTAPIPILHLTTRSADSTMATEDAYLVQPTPPEEIIAAVKALIERRAGK